MQSTTILKVAGFVFAGVLLGAAQSQAPSANLLPPDKPAGDPAVSGSSISASPVSASPVSASPVSASPVSASPAGASSGSASSVGAGGVAPFSQHDPRYTVRPDDIMEVTFEFSPEFNQTVTVQPDGFVALRGAGDVHVGGESVPEVTATIKNAYAKILNAPSVAVVLKDFQKPYFIAAGNVAKPGKYELRDDTTLTEAVAIAGGFDKDAKHSKVVLYRKVANDRMEGKVVDLKKMMASRDLSEDIHLQPGDMIFVPRSTFSKFERFIPTPGAGLGWMP
jgi:polysaccharide export outer membrane protein